MRDTDFDRLVDRRASASLKWQKYKDSDTIPLWVADMDFISPQPVIDALQDRADHGVFGYTVAPDDLVETVLQTLEDEYGWQVQADWLIWLPGLVTGLNVSCRAVGEKGDDVLTAIPIYPPFMSAPRFQGRNTVKAPLELDGGRWRFDLDRFERAITDRTRLFLHCSPYNPVGRAFSKQELVELADVCERRDLVICSDEIHCGLILDRDKEHIPTAMLDPAVAERTITLMAPSKTYNIAGLGCSFAVISNPELRRNFRRAMAGIVPEINLFGYTAAIAAYRHGGEWLRAVLDYLRGNRQLVMDAVQSMPGLATTHVEATYLAWIDARETGLEDPAAFFENAGVGMSDGRYFDGPGFLRLNFGCARPLLEKALKRMERALQRL